MLNVMKSVLRQLIALVSAILFSIIVPAQELPVMPGDPDVVSGVLPNGMSYYIASNFSCKGVADFALIQKTGRKNVTDTSGNAVVQARKGLTLLPRPDHISPVGFFSSHGSVPGDEGYVKVEDDATIYRFRNVRLDDGKAVLDSAVLVLLDMAGRSVWTDDPFLGKWYSPSDQAIIISGDVDAKQVISRLEPMSYMISSRSSADRVPLLQDRVPTNIVTQTCLPSGMRLLSAEWMSGRAPREYMNTVQPQIFNMSLDVLGRVAVRRIKMALKAAGVPYADVSSRHIASDRNPYDDSFSVRIVTASEYAEKASGILCGVMAAIDAEGVATEEYLVAEAAFLADLKRYASDPVKENEDYVDRCIYSFLYGSSLASPVQKYEFHTSRNLPDSLRCRLFNDVAAALLYPLESEAENIGALHLTSADTSAFPGAAPKVKVRSSRRDHISGGTVITFSNGFKVVYKDLPSDGDIFYTLALNGGYGSIQGLGEGEGAFASDMFRLSRICGFEADDFFGLLKKEGITMDARITLSNILIGGSLPKDRISLLMRALLALANERTGNGDAYPYYMDCTELALEYSEGRYESRMTAIDSIMCPDYRYSPYKSKGKLTDSFFSKADAFLSSQMAKVNDGVLVIVGDIGEERLKKALLPYVGGFRTKESAVRRPVLRYQPVSGWSTYTVAGEKNAVDIALSARMPLTASNYIAAQMAVMLLERSLAEALADSGMTLNISYNCRIYPEERLNLLISVWEADEEGFAEGMVVMPPIDALGDIRKVLSDMGAQDITETEFRQCKSYLKNMMAIDMADPHYWVDAIILRHLDGKDLTTGYASGIDAVTIDAVRNIFSFLDQGSKIEYVTTNRYVSRNNNSD